jgi:hypothetical protein
MGREQLELQIEKEEIKRDQCNINIERWKKQLAELEVLSVAKLAVKIITNDHLFGFSCSHHDAETIAAFCDKNGQQREYYRKEQIELRDAVESWIERIRFDGYPEKRINREAERIVIAFKNLKPPKGETQ